MGGRPEQALATDRPTTDRPTATDWRRTWLTPRAVAMHITLLVVVPVFAGLFWWQVQRVRQGNTLSWAYVFEWPFFAAYAVYMWWKLVHDHAVVANEPAETEPTTPTSPVSGPVSRHADDDEEMAAYNQYLAELEASGRRKRW